MIKVCIPNNFYTTFKEWLEEYSCRYEAHTCYYYFGDRLNNCICCGYFSIDMQEHDLPLFILKYGHIGYQHLDGRVLFIYESNMFDGPTIYGQR